MNSDPANNLQKGRLLLDQTRLMQNLETLAQIGQNKRGGVQRLALSDFDRQGRDQIAQWMKNLKLSVKIDQIGNMFGVRTGREDLPPVMTGSHIDSVANGGKLDGSLGVLAALEVVETLNQHQLETRRPLVVAVFTNEEGARFQPDMMGSLVYAGGLSAEAALNTRDAEGAILGEELSRIGYAGNMPCGEFLPAAFVELHIEQGPILEQEGITIGVVENLQGISWTEVIITGQANHAGTTPMHLRKDAGYCAAVITTFVHDLAEQIGRGQVGTIGVTELKPDIINVVPGYAKITVDLRNADNQLLIEAEQRLNSFLVQLAKANAVDIKSKSLARFEPVDFDENIVQVIEKNATRLNHSCRRMTSGAGHDAQMMSRICPTAMIFTPSINGVSHNPAESTSPEDLMAGANVLLHTLLDLCES